MKEYMTPPADPDQDPNPERVMMLTTDIAFKFDPEGKYQQLINDFAGDQEKVRLNRMNGWCLFIVGCQSVCTVAAHART